MVYTFFTYVGYSMIDIGLKSYLRRKRTMATSSTKSSPSASTSNSSSTSTNNSPVLLRILHDGKIKILGVYPNGEKQLIELMQICPKHILKNSRIAKAVIRKKIKRFFGLAILTPPVQELLTELEVIYSSKSDPTPEGEEIRALVLQAAEERMDRKRARWYYE